MRKLALPVVLLCTLLSQLGQASQPPTPSAGKETSQDGNTQGQSKQRHPGPPLQGTQESPLWVKVIQAGTDKTETKPNQEKSENGSAQKGRTDPNWLIAIFTIVLALIAAIQAGFFFWQLSMLRKSLEDSKTAAGAAKSAAESAKKSADIATNSERAWVITSGVAFAPDLADLTNPDGPKKSKIVIRICNCGRSPAEMESVHIVAIVYPANFKFPDSPIYGESEEIFEVAAMPGEIIESDGKQEIICRIRHHDLLTNDQIKDILDGKQVVYCYGRIHYRDISSSKRATHFGYYYRVRASKTDDIPEAMYRLNSRAYNYTE
jgi:hypothetical protein